jgi:hypothetical protein
VKATLLFYLLATTTLFAGPTLKAQKGYRAPTDIFTEYGRIQIRTVVADAIILPWKELTAKDTIFSQAGTATTRTDTYEFSDGTLFTHTAEAKVFGSDVICKGAWKTSNPVKGFTYMLLGLPEELTRDLTIEHGDTPVFPGADKYIKIKKTATFIFRQKSTGTFLFKVSGDYVGATIEFHKSHPEWGLSLRLEKIPNWTETMLSEPMELNWMVSFKA